MKNINQMHRVSFSNKAALFFAMALLPIGISAQSSRDTTGKETQIEEVVVIGYGTQKRGDVNSSISSVKAKDLQDIKQVSVDQMLQGKLSGVQVQNGSGQPGAAASIRVRGTTSITGTNEPLYIIDGVPITGDATGQSTSGRPIAGGDFSSTGGSGSVAVSPISFLNPNDIETIDVLKDASATAIYGSRGANGVIIITTKSGKKGQGKISYEGYTSISSVPKKLDVMNLQEFAIHQNNLARAFNLPDNVRPEFEHPELLGKGTDWQDAIYRTAVSQNHQIAFSGGKDNVNYYISTSFLNQEGNLINTGLKRYTTRANIDAKVKDWLKVGMNITGGISNEKFTINQSFSGLISNTLLQAPDMPIRNLDGTYAAPPAGQNVNYFNPVAEALTNKNSLERKNFLGSVYAEAQILKGLKYRIELAANTEFSENVEFRPAYDRGSQFNLTADLYNRDNNWYTTNIKNLLTYDFSLANHKFTLLAGQEANDTHWKGTNAEGHGFKSNEIYSLSLAEDTQIQQWKGSQAMSSYFGRILYDYDGRYSISASIRRDESSKFDPLNPDRVGIFPAVAISWRITNEKFMQWLPESVSNIKFRAGYGETGNQQIGNNLYSSQLTQYNMPANMNNPSLKWETMKQTNVGLDMTLFSRLNLSLDWYEKKSSDFLFRLPLPGYLNGGTGQYGGMDAPYSNIGEMMNRGLDLSLNYRTNGETFNWSTNFVGSHYKNNLNYLVDGLSHIPMEVNLNGYQPMTATNTLIGNPIGMFWGYKTDGIFRTMEDLQNAPVQFDKKIGTAPGETYLGDVRYVDINGDGVVDNKDLTIIGNPHPDFTFGWTNTFTYKNLDLSFFFQGSIGNDVMNLTKRSGTHNAQLFQNYLVDAADYWSLDNPNSNNPRPINSTSNTNILISDRYIEKGDYVRLQNITLGYTLNNEFAHKLNLSKFRLYVTAQNLFTITDYTGYDPEIGSFNQNVLLTGIDNGRYPSPRTFTFGVNLDF